MVVMISHPYAPGIPLSGAAGMMLKVAIREVSLLQDVRYLPLILWVPSTTYQSNVRAQVSAESKSQCTVDLYMETNAEKETENSAVDLVATGCGRHGVTMVATSAQRTTHLGPNAYEWKFSMELEA